MEYKVKHKNLEYNIVYNKRKTILTVDGNECVDVKHFIKAKALAARFPQNNNLMLLIQNEKIYVFDIDSNDDISSAAQKKFSVKKSLITNILGIFSLFCYCLGSILLVANNTNSNYLPVIFYILAFMISTYLIDMFIKNPKIEQKYKIILYHFVKNLFLIALFIISIITVV